MPQISFAKRKVVVMGLGRFGGGVGVSRWLAREGAKVTVTDLADESELTESIAELQGLAIEFHLGEHDPGDLDDAELVVVNPAVDKSQSDFVQAARARGIPISSEMNLFFERCPAKIIGITGSTGKSTTAAMIFDVLYAQVKQLTGQPENVWLGGNIGESLLSDIPNMTHRDYAVLELSSFQLDDLASLGKSPHVSILTNLTPHHLDRHGSFDNYIRAKINIFAHQSDQDFALIGEQAAGVLAERGVNAGLGRRITFGPAGELAGQLRVLGDHNLHNAAAALHVGRLLGLSDQTVVDELKHFQGLPHRLEFVRTYNGVSYYNDSKATTPQAAITAMRAFEEKMVLLCGGCDRGEPLAELAEAICAHARVVICGGQNRAKIARNIRRLKDRCHLPVIKSVHDFAGGINLARRLAQPGEAVLFSPAAASYDQFLNYELRGNQFKGIVNGWI